MKIILMLIELFGALLIGFSILLTTLVSKVAYKLHKLAEKLDRGAWGVLNKFEAWIRGLKK